MSTPSQGTSGPSGYTVWQRASSLLFGGNYVVSQPTSTQTSPEQSMANQIRTLTVRLLPLFSVSPGLANHLVTHQRTVETLLTLHQVRSVALFLG